ncbi:Glu-tRNA(Gln) amidotransferase subunit GatE [Caldiplasma sukawensis]
MEKLKIGLEVHLQLNTGKLFCRCENEGIEKERKFERNLHVSKGETGTTDISTEYEISRGKKYSYRVTTNSCLVEADEKPPDSPSENALSAALSVAEKVHSDVPDKIIFMRKVVVDGSNTSGFQRTGLIGMGGWIDIDSRRIGIQTVCLEEDACRKIGENEETVEYSLERLGIPLIEISTAPDIENAKEAIRVAEFIGDMILSSGLLRKGADAIRQDVNVSLGYGRVEIKGVSKLSLIGDVIEREISREKKLAEAVKIWKERGGYSKLELIDVTNLFVTTNSRVLLRHLEKGERIFGGLLKNASGLLKKGEFRIGREIADALKQFGIMGMIHSDEIPAYGLTDIDSKKIMEYLDGKENDAFLLIGAEMEKFQILENIINERSEKILSLDFSETRAADDEGNTRYMRPLSGSSRMYPETDVEAIVSSKVKKRYDILLKEERISRMTTNLKISPQDAETLIKTGQFSFVEKFGDENNGKILARLLIQTIPEIEKKRGIRFHIMDVQRIVEYCRDMNLPRISYEFALELISSGKKFDEIKDGGNLIPLSEKEIEEAINSSDFNEQKNLGALLSELREKFLRPVDPSILLGIIKRLKK